MQENPIDRRQFRIAELVDAYPPQWRHRNKRIVYEIACSGRTPPDGWLGYTRWRSMPLSARYGAGDHVCDLNVRPGVYDYQPTTPQATSVLWHVNFADPELFVAYGSPLFAQDEMQVAEHPALGSLKQALEAEGAAARTVENGKPTPILLTGVPRQCRIATEPDLASGRPAGLFGNRFALGPARAIRRATTPIDPPDITHLIAMAAPSHGTGRYRKDEIRLVLDTACTGFSAARLESERMAHGARVEVHTGFWGCGAFGGNRVLLPLLQFVAADLARINRLVFHAFDAPGEAHFDEARILLDQYLARHAVPAPVERFVDWAVSLGLEWNVGDGN